MSSVAETSIGRERPASRGVGVEVGVDIGGTKMLMLARAPDGQLVAEARIPTGATTIGKDLDDGISRFCDGLNRPVARLAVAVPGLVDDHRVVRFCDVLPGLAGWRPEVDLLVNDIRAALASALDTAPTAGAVAGVGGPVLCVVAGTAVGAAFTDAHGATFGGAAGWAGELGYMPLGGAGGSAVRRLDDIAGGASLIADLSLSADDIHHGLEAGEDRILARVEAAGEALGLGLATCVNLLNPRVLVLGGGSCRFPGYREAALRAAEAHCLPESWATLRVERFHDDERFAADGALAAARALNVRSGRDDE